MSTGLVPKNAITRWHEMTIWAAAVTAHAMEWFLSRKEQMNLHRLFRIRTDGIFKKWTGKRAGHRFLWQDLESV